MQPTPTIESFLSPSCTWSKMDSRSFLVQKTDEVGKQKDYAVPVGELKKIHPDLATILLTRFDVKTKSKRMPKINGGLIRDTVHLFQRGARQIMGANGTLRYCTSLLNINPGACVNDLVWIDAEVVTLIYGGFCTSKTRIEEALLSIPSTQPFVLRSDTSRFPVTQEHLNTDFPGWRERLRMTKGSNMDPSTRLTAIFARPLVPQEDDEEHYGLESAPLSVNEL